jgi:hypothetical protein
VPEREPVLFRKTSAIFGQAPAGEEVYVFLPMRLGQNDWSETERRHCAWRIFKRDRPDENPMEWEMVAAPTSKEQRESR